jgi:hypothetical protein
VDDTLLVAVWRHERLLTTQTLLAARAITRDAIAAHLSDSCNEGPRRGTLADDTLAVTFEEAGELHHLIHEGIGFRGRRRTASLLADPIHHAEAEQLPASGTADSSAATAATADTASPTADTLRGSGTPESISLTLSSEQSPRPRTSTSTPPTSRYLSPDDFHLDTAAEEAAYAGAAAELALIQLVRAWHSSTGTGGVSHNTPPAPPTLVQSVYGPVLARALARRDGSGSEGAAQ